MKWEMEVEEIEAVLEKIWDLHDKLSDAIHSISRAHFHNSIKSQNRKSQSQSQSQSNDDDIFLQKKRASGVAATNGCGDDNRTGFVYIKDFSFGFDADFTAALQEAKSLNVVRTALENLEEQLEFFHVSDKIEVFVSRVCDSSPYTAMLIDFLQHFKKIGYFYSIKQR